MRINIVVSRWNPVNLICPIRVRQTADRWTARWNRNHRSQIHATPIQRYASADTPYRSQMAVRRAEQGKGGDVVRAERCRAAGSAGYLSGHDTGSQSVLQA